MNDQPVTADDELLELLRGGEIGAFRLDGQLKLRWITPAASAATGLLPDDIGHPVTGRAPAAGAASLAARARVVMAHLAPLQDEVEGQDGRWFMRRILPHGPASGPAGGPADGVIVVLTDITATKLSAAAALAEREALAAALEARVEERTRELGRLAGALSLAEDRERRAVAADLHDDLAQRLSLVKLKLVGLTRLRDASGVRSAIDEIAALIDTADARVRSLATQLGNPVLHQLGLVAALGALSDEMRRDYSLEVQVHDDGAAKDLEPPVGIIVYRAVRELLINVAKHAGTLRSRVRCEVDCHTQGNTLVVVVSDDGRGFEPQDLDLRGRAGNGLGLPMIRERLRFIGGRFDIASRPSAGVEATIMVPLDATSAVAGTRA
ncbi:MAG: ATP-binding protein [Chromatiales bacterium]|nr:ATP-binding protein [Chromatiales bacterium]